jgi:hypothetical protein
MDALQELLVQAGGAQRPLTGVVVDVEHAALGPRRRRGVQIEDGGLDAAHVQDTSEHEPAEARADDGDGVVREGRAGGHGGLLPGESGVK